MRSSDTPNTVGQRVKFAREHLGMSQRELGKGIASASHVSLIESGSREPSLRLLEALADRLQTSSDYLLTGQVDGRLAQHDVQVRKAEVLLAAGENDDALELLQTLMGNAPRTRARELGFLRAQAFENLGRHRDAVFELEGMGSDASSEGNGPSHLTSAIALTRNYRELGELSYAVDVGERCLAQAEQDNLQQVPQFAQLVATLAAAYLERGDITRGEWLLNKGLAACAAEASSSRGALLWNLALAAEQRGDLDLARELITQAQLLFSGWNDDRNRARLQIAVAGLALRGSLPDLVAVRQQLAQARELLTRGGSQTDLAYCSCEQARLALLADDPRGAITLAREAIHSLGEDDLETGRALALISRAWAALGDAKAAHDTLELAAGSLEKAQASRQAAVVWRELADLTGHLGRPETANLYLAKALDAMGIAGAGAAHARYRVSP